MKVIVSLLLLLGSLFTTAHAELFGDFGAPAWSRQFKYIESRFGAVAKDEVVLVLPTATNAAWDDPVQVMRSVEMQGWGDLMPSNAWQYARNANKRVSDGYRFFLNSAFVATVDADGTASASLKNALKRSNEEVQSTRADYNQIVKESNDAYEAYVAVTPWLGRKSKESFLKDQGYNVEIDVRKKRFNASLETFAKVTKNIKGADMELLTQAQIRFENPNQQILLPPVREVLNDKSRWEKQFVSYIDKNILTFLADKVPQNQVIEEVSSKSEYFEKRWQASMSVSFLGLLRAGGASAEQVTREKHIKENTTKIEISFDNLDTFNIQRGEWFSQNVIDRFAPKLNPDVHTAMWGPNGQLEMIPKSLLVGRGMSFTIYADSKSLDYLYEHFNAAADAGFFIGYWRVGGGGEYSSTKEVTEVKKFSDKIVFKDLSGRAKVLAVLAKYYNASLPKPTVPQGFFDVTNEDRDAARKQIEALWKRPNLEEMMKGAMAPESVRELYIKQ